MIVWSHFLSYRSFSSGCGVTSCPADQLLDFDLCMCISNTQHREIFAVADNTEECQAPPSGCAITYQWDQDLCRCVEVSSNLNLRPYNTNIECEMPGDGCERGYVWNNIICQCQWLDSPANSPDEFCSNPVVTCPGNQKWDQDLCACRTLPGAEVCQPPREGCRKNKRWDSNRCKCVKPSKNNRRQPKEELQEPQPCVLPAGGCRIGHYFDREFCQCRKTSTYS